MVPIVRHTDVFTEWNAVLQRICPKMGRNRSLTADETAQGALKMSLHGTQVTIVGIQLWNEILITEGGYRVDP